MEELIAGVGRITEGLCSIYYVRYLSDEFKTELRKRLTSMCMGPEDEYDPMFTYKETVKEFLQRCTPVNQSKSDNNSDIVQHKGNTRIKGMIGELLVHVILELDGTFMIVSPFFNMEERSFKKGFDVVLYDVSTEETWFTEVKSGELNEATNSSVAMIKLLDVARYDFENRLNDQNSNLWLNAINSVRFYIGISSDEAKCVRKYLNQCRRDTEEGLMGAKDHNVILAGTLFNSLDDLVSDQDVRNKYISIESSRIFRNLAVIAIQENTFEELYDFLKSEVENE